MHIHAHTHILSFIWGGLLFELMLSLPLHPAQPGFQCCGGASACGTSSGVASTSEGGHRPHCRLDIQHCDDIFVSTVWQHTGTELFHPSYGGGLCCKLKATNIGGDNCVQLFITLQSVIQHAMSSTLVIQELCVCV